MPLALKPLQLIFNQFEGDSILGIQMLFNGVFQKGKRSIKELRLQFY